MESGDYIYTALYLYRQKSILSTKVLWTDFLIHRTWERCSIWWGPGRYLLPTEDLEETFVVRRSWESFPHILKKIFWLEKPGRVFPFKRPGRGILYLNNYKFFPLWRVRRRFLVVKTWEILHTLEDLKSSSITRRSGGGLLSIDLKQVSIYRFRDDIRVIERFMKGFIFFWKLREIFYL